MDSDTRPTYGVAQALMSRVFAWMSVAVGISGVAAVLTAGAQWLYNPTLFFVLFFIQFGLVIGLSAGITRISYAAAQAMFILYALITGITLSSLFTIYTTASIAQVFFIAASMFAVMAIYGAYTKTDLSRYRSLLTMALIGLVISLVVNIFLKSSTLDFITSAVGVLLFCGLTAFDIQRIQQLATTLFERDEMWNKIALIGALQLYLDLLNLFLSLLNLSGKRK